MDGLIRPGGASGAFGAAPAGAARARRRSARRSALWRVRAPLGRRAYLAIAIGSFVLLVLLWWAVAAAELLDPVFLPGPVATFRSLVDWYEDGTLLDDIGMSFWRVTAGFLMSAVMAVPLGLFISAFRPVRAFFEPMMEFARYLPAVAFVPLVLIWFGLGETAKIALIWIGTFFQMVLMIAEDVARVPEAQIESARTLGANNGEVLRLVLFRSALPAMLDTLRITLGWAWTYLVVAEIVAANSGLGYEILRAQRFMQTDRIFVGILLIGAIGLACDQAIRRLHRLMFPWLR
jgi:NitT/TauT family transport system permease protein